MSKTYIIQGQTFTSKELSLGVNQSINDLRLMSEAFNEAEYYKYLSSPEYKPLSDWVTRENELQTAKAQIEKILKDGTKDGVALVDLQMQDYKAQSEKLTDTIKENNILISTDWKLIYISKKAQALRQESNDKFYDEYREFKKDLMNMLDGDWPQIDWENPEMKDFCKGVVEDFFALTTKSV